MSEKYRETLERSVFEPNNENLVSYVLISFLHKGGKKKILTFLLTVSVKKEQPFKPMLIVISLNNKGKSKKLYKYSLELVDTFNAKQDIDTNEIDFTFPDGVEVTFSIPSMNEKNEFVDIIWQTFHRYCKKIPNIKNYQKIELPEKTVREVTTVTKKVEIKPIHNIKEEEIKLLEIVHTYGKVITDIDFFTKTLNDTLDDLKWTNFEAICLSELYSQVILDRLDDCLTTVDAYEDTLNRYENSLMDLRMQIKELEMIDSDRIIRINNQKSLLDSLIKYIASFDISDDAIQFIKENQYEKNLEKCYEIMEGFVKGFQISVPEAVKIIPAIKEQYSKISLLTNEFVKNLLNIIINYFKQYETDFMSKPSPEDLVMFNHFTMQQYLKSYFSIVEGIKIIDSQRYTMLYNEYCSIMTKIYSKQVKDLIQHFNEMMTISLQQNCGNSLQKAQKDTYYFRIEGGTEIYVEDFKNNFTQLIYMFEYAIEKEIHFSCEFFKFAIYKKENEEINQVSNKENQREFIKTKALINQIFCFIAYELKNLCEIYSKIFTPLTICIVNKTNILIKKNTNPILLGIYSSWQVIIKDKFTSILSHVEHGIDDNKLWKKVRSVTMMNSMAIFEDFVRTTEYILMGKGEKSEIFYTIYCNLLVTLYRTIEGLLVPETYLKTSTMMIENYLYLTNFLQSIKLDCFADHIKECKTRTEKAITNFVIHILNEQMKSLYSFFNGIETSLKRGVLYNEINIQAAHSFQRLLDIIKQYDKKNVTKIVEHGFKVIIKYFNDHNMCIRLATNYQIIFIDKFKNIFMLFSKCYPIIEKEWDLNIQDVFNVFSQIDITKIGH